MSLLAEILASKRREIEALRARPRTTPHAPRAPLDVVRALSRASGERLRLVAEVKLRSPSAGPLSARLAPEARAVAYAECGVAMVSVLCDAPFFGGAWEHLASARRALPSLPLLAKEFVLDERQIEEAADRGADAVLLIARLVDSARLRVLASAARAAGVEPFVEVVDESELEAALGVGARVVGVNARDLDTLAMDAARASRVLGAVPRGVVAVHLSGLRSEHDVRTLALSRADAALVGEVLMREHDPRPLLGRLLYATRT
jgi:indole-3-glycerol phosphate synthase